MADRWDQATATVLHVTGRLDGTSVGEARERLHAAMAAADFDVVLDVTGVECIDITGLGMIMDAHWRLRRQDRRLVLRGCPPQMRRALAVTRLRRVLVIDRDEAAPSAA
jgi:anti-sigma B factor antagonist